MLLFLFLATIQIPRVSSALRSRSPTKPNWALRSTHSLPTTTGQERLSRELKNSTDSQRLSVRRGIELDRCVCLPKNLAFWISGRAHDIHMYVCILHNMRKSSLFAQVAVSGFCQFRIIVNSSGVYLPMDKFVWSHW